MLAARYRDLGYDVLTISDHWTMTKIDAPAGLVLVPGAELMVDPVAGPMCPEFLAIGIDDVPASPSGDPANWYAYENSTIRTFATFDDGIDYVEGFGGATILCHPAWSGLPETTVAAARAMHGIEVWNASAHRENDRGDSAYVWDSPARRRRRARAVRDRRRALRRDRPGRRVDDGSGRGPLARGGGGGAACRARVRVERPAILDVERDGETVEVSVLAGARGLAPRLVGGGYRPVDGGAGAVRRR